MFFVICAYMFIVVIMSECPSLSWISFIPAPVSIKREVWVCVKLCGVIRLSTMFVNAINLCKRRPTYFKTLG